MVTALDECPLASVKVHLFAISHILVQEGCHQVGDIISSGSSPWVSPGQGDIYDFDIIAQLRECLFVLVIQTVTCPGGLSWSAFRPQGSAGQRDTTIIPSRPDRKPKFTDIP